MTLRNATQTMIQGRIKVPRANGDADRIRSVNHEPTDFFSCSCMVSPTVKMKITLDRHGPRLMPYNFQLLDPSNFSLPTIFTANSSVPLCPSSCSPHSSSNRFPDDFAAYFSDPGYSKTCTVYSYMYSKYNKSREYFQSIAPVADKLNYKYRQEHRS